MKLGPVTKRDNKNKAKFDIDYILKLCDVIAVFPVHIQFGVARKPHSGRIVCITFCLTKSEKRTKKSLTPLSHYCFE